KASYCPSENLHTLSHASFVLYIYSIVDILPYPYSFPTRRSSDLLSRQMTTSTTSIDIMGLQAAYANLHTDQERDYFMQRYHDVISSFGGKTSYDADNRPLLVMRSNLWASGYDVDGTDQ